MESIKVVVIFIVMVFFLTPLPVVAAKNKGYCGELKGFHFGPFDYMDRFNRKESLSVVEVYHFTPNVENLISGESGYLGGDLDYTLHAWPNHHRALISLIKYSIREKTTRIPHMKYPVECYFDRAIRMNTKDAQVRSIYSAFLSRHNRNKEALEQLQVAVDLEPDNPLFLYNLGLQYFKMKQYDKANDYANRAYALDFPLSGLRNKLKQVGKWHEIAVKKNATK